MKFAADSAKSESAAWAFDRMLLVADDSEVAKLLHVKFL